jgi:hypothetical protein
MVEAESSMRDNLPLNVVLPWQAQRQFYQRAEEPAVDQVLEWYVAIPV